jgi:5-methylcytosine-specific restriction enzyme A
LHCVRERDQRLVKLKKAAVLKRHGMLACEICGFVFARTYGKRGADFIECHHILPLSALGAVLKTKLDDLVLLCANCHRMIHVARPWLTIAELRRVIDAARSDA